MSRTVKIKMAVTLHNEAEEIDLLRGVFEEYAADNAQVINDLKPFLHRGTFLRVRRPAAGRPDTPVCIINVSGRPDGDNDYAVAYIDDNGDYQTGYVNIDNCDVIENPGAKPVTVVAKPARERSRSMDM